MIEPVKTYRLNKSEKIEYGVCKQGEEYIFTCAFDVKSEISLTILNTNWTLLEEFRIDEYKIAGNVYSVKISGINLKEFFYYYTVDGRKVSDPYMRRKAFRRDYGKSKDDYTFDEKSNIFIEASAYKVEESDYLLVERKSISQTDVIAYQLHVRGFTKHSSSKVKGKGCFLGITEKIPYLVGLGINQVELMPAYDFYEFDEKKLNYWGYKQANYFCPKYEYSYSEDAVKEFKQMVEECHRCGIEVIMQMFYPRKEKASIILDSLKYWYTEYRVDGFHVMGERLPYTLILGDDLLADAKIYINNLDRNDELIESLSSNRNVIDVSDSFMISMRRYLKSDSDSLNGFVYSNRTNSPVYRSINYLTRYEGFTLNDLVSYEHKHNEDNGENNIDGTEYNFSWNCGVEGKTLKKSVKELRMRQIKNALCMLLLSQGTPMIFMGDEFMNSQSGNNNPYCIDNETTWLNWKLNKSSEEIFKFAKELICFRKEHKVFHQNVELKSMDYIQCGNPDISYHQDMAWKSNLNSYLLHIGIMLDGRYADCECSGNANSNSYECLDDTFYIAYNMHWENHLFGLPRLKSGQKWSFVFASCDDTESDEITKDLNSSQEEICIYKRSIVVLKAVKTEITTKKKGVKSIDKEEK